MVYGIAYGICLFYPIGPLYLSLIDRLSPHSCALFHCFNGYNRDWSNLEGCYRQPRCHIILKRHCTIVTRVYFFNSSQRFPHIFFFFALLCLQHVRCASDRRMATAITIYSASNAFRAQLTDRRATQTATRRQHLLAYLHLHIYVGTWGLDDFRAKKISHYRFTKMLYIYV